LNWQKIYARDRYDVSSPDFSLTKKDIGNALYYSSHLGLSKVTCSLISSGEDIDFQVDPCSALQAAALEGHETVVRLLLTAGADINAQDRKYGNALQAAVFADMRQRYSNCSLQEQMSTLNVDIMAMLYKQRPLQT
jgi:ankyrin repeat protein